MGRKPGPVKAQVRLCVSQLAGQPVTVPFKCLCWEPVEGMNHEGNESNYSAFLSSVSPCSTLFLL